MNYWYLAPESITHSLATIALSPFSLMAEHAESLEMGTMAKAQVWQCFLLPPHWNCARSRTDTFDIHLSPLVETYWESCLKLFQSATQSLTFYACSEPTRLNSFLFALNQKEPFVHAVSSAATPLSLVHVHLLWLFVSLPPRNVQKPPHLHNWCSLSDCRIVYQVTVVRWITNHQDLPGSGLESSKWKLNFSCSLSNGQSSQTEV